MQFSNSKRFFLDCYLNTLPVYNLGDDEHDEEFIYGADYDEVLDVLAEKFAEVYGIDVGIAECILGDFDLYGPVQFYFIEN